MLRLTLSTLGRLALLALLLPSGAAAASGVLTGTDHLQIAPGLIWVDRVAGKGLGLAADLNAARHVDLRIELDFGYVQSLTSSSILGSLVLFGGTERIRPYLALSAGQVDPGPAAQEAAFGGRAGLEAAAGPFVMDVGLTRLEAGDLGATAFSGGLGAWVAPSAMLFVTGSTQSGDGGTAETTSIGFGLAVRARPDDGARSPEPAKPAGPDRAL